MGRPGTSTFSVVALSGMPGDPFGSISLRCGLPPGASGVPSGVAGGGAPGFVGTGVGWGDCVPGVGVVCGAVAEAGGVAEGCVAVDGLAGAGVAEPAELGGAGVGLGCDVSFGEAAVPDVAAGGAGVLVCASAGPASPQANARPKTKPVQATAQGRRRRARRSTSSFMQLSPGLLPTQSRASLDILSFVPRKRRGGPDGAGFA